jgi:hypothetical protein
MIHKFRSKIKDVTLWGECGLGNSENENPIEVDEIIVNWQIELELREYGVKYISIYVTDFSFTIYQEADYGIDSEKPIEGFEDEKTMKDLAYKVEVCHDDFKYDSISLESCEIDFDDKTVTFY